MHASPVKSSSICNRPVSRSVDDDCKVRGRRSSAVPHSSPRSSASPHNAPREAFVAPRPPPTLGLLSSTKNDGARPPTGVLSRFGSAASVLPSAVSTRERRGALLGELRALIGTMLCDVRTYGSVPSALMEAYNSVVDEAREDDASPPPVATMLDAAADGDTSTAAALRHARAQLAGKEIELRRLRSTVEDLVAENRAQSSEIAVSAATHKASEERETSLKARLAETDQRLALAMGEAAQERARATRLQQHLQALKLDEDQRFLARTADLRQQLNTTHEMLRSADEGIRSNEREALSLKQSLRDQEHAHAEALRELERLQEQNHSLEDDASILQRRIQTRDGLIRRMDAALHGLLLDSGKSSVLRRLADVDTRWRIVSQRAVATVRDETPLVVAHLSKSNVLTVKETIEKIPEYLRQLSSVPPVSIRVKPFTSAALNALALLILCDLMELHGARFQPHNKVAVYLTKISGAARKATAVGWAIFACCRAVNMQLATTSVPAPSPAASPSGSTFVFPTVEEGSDALPELQINAPHIPEASHNTTQRRKRVVLNREPKAVPTVWQLLRDHPGTLERRAGGGPCGWTLLLDLVLHDPDVAPVAPVLCRIVFEAVDMFLHLCAEAEACDLAAADNPGGNEYASIGVAVADLLEAPSLLEPPESRRFRRSSFGTLAPGPGSPRGASSPAPSPPPASSSKLRYYVASTTFWRVLKAFFTENPAHLLKPHSLLRLRALAAADEDDAPIVRYRDLFAFRKHGIPSAFADAFVHSILQCAAGYEGMIRRTLITAMNDGHGGRLAPSQSSSSPHSSPKHHQQNTKMEVEWSERSRIAASWASLWAAEDPARLAPPASPYSLAVEGGLEERSNADPLRVLMGGSPGPASVSAAAAVQACMESLNAAGATQTITVDTFMRHLHLGVMQTSNKSPDRPRSLAESISACTLMRLAISPSEDMPQRDAGDLSGWCPLSDVKDIQLEWYGSAPTQSAPSRRASINFSPTAAGRSASVIARRPSGLSLGVSLLPSAALGAEGAQSMSRSAPPLNMLHDVWQTISDPSPTHQTGSPSPTQQLLLGARRPSNIDAESPLKAQSFVAFPRTQNSSPIPLQGTPGHLWLDGDKTQLSVKRIAVESLSSVVVPTLPPLALAKQKPSCS